MAPRFSLADIGYISLGGILGSLLRTWIGIGYDGVFPIPTVLINILGACALGLLYGSQHRIHPHGRYLYMVGFCGSFTTVSLFAFETVTLLERGNPLMALLNVLLPVGIAVALVAYLVPWAEKAMGKDDQ